MHKIIIGLLLVASNSTFACTASENFDIYFDINSSVIQNSEVVRVANRVADIKNYYANHATGEATLISGHAEESERLPQELAKSRLQAGRELLEQLGFLRGTVRASTRVYSHDDVDNGRRVEISFLPDCPNKCCTGN
ncbi:hypothetical protein [Burkholderia catarinensis]|uniref:hypothetical protein n=1 Tax=Burkholderia catarinensis TaxID=1108140 RepID=UPI001008496A|nr:hypothetical protein [Burkholderia catarinensis]KAG8150716.1 hypothetical protein BFF94_026295 [Burkholderia catarinensis]